MKEMVYRDKSIAELLDSGTYDDYEYEIVSRGLHPCAYVKLPEGHKYYGLGYDDVPVDCHCGLTYAENYLSILPLESGWWIGWDYGHCCDYSGFMMHEHWKDVDTSHYKKWTTAEIFEEVKQVIDQLKELHDTVNEVLAVGVLNENEAKNIITFFKQISISEINLKKSCSAENAEKSLREILRKLNNSL